MATLYVSMTIELNGVDEETAKDAIRSAVEGVGGYVLDPTLTGMLVEIDRGSRGMLRQAIRDAVDGFGGDLDSITIA